jgi:hypothetical protein
MNSVIGELLFDCSSGRLNWLEPLILKLELRCRGVEPGELTKSEIVEVLSTLNCQLRDCPNKQAKISKIKMERKHWFVEEELTEEEENIKEEDEDIEVQTAQASEEIVCKSDAIVKKSVEVESESQKSQKMGKSLEINLVPKGKSFAVNSLPGKIPKGI